MINQTIMCKIPEGYKLVPINYELGFYIMILILFILLAICLFGILDRC